MEKKRKRRGTEKVMCQHTVLHKHGLAYIIIEPILRGTCVMQGRHKYVIRNTS